jgi:hypothetical protein
MYIATYFDAVGSLMITNMDPYLKYTGIQFNNE